MEPISQNENNNPKSFGHIVIIQHLKIKFNLKIIFLVKKWQVLYLNQNLI